MNRPLPVGGSGLGLKLVESLLSASSVRSGVRAGKHTSTEKTAKVAAAADEGTESTSFSSVIADLLQPAPVESPKPKATFGLNLFGSAEAVAEAPTEVGTQEVATQEDSTAKKPTSGNVPSVMPKANPFVNQRESLTIKLQGKAAMVASLPKSPDSSAVSKGEEEEPTARESLGNLPDAELRLMANQDTSPSKLVAKLNRKAPVTSSPVVTAPVLTTPVPATPVLATPILATPVLTTPVPATPVLATPILATPVLTTPVLVTPVLTAPLLPSPALVPPAPPPPALVIPASSSPTVRTGISVAVTANKAPARPASSSSTIHPEPSKPTVPLALTPVTPEPIALSQPTDTQPAPLAPSPEPIHTTSEETASKALPLTAITNSSLPVELVVDLRLREKQPEVENRTEVKLEPREKDQAPSAPKPVSPVAVPTILTQQPERRAGEAVEPVTPPSHSYQNQAPMVHIDTPNQQPVHSNAASPDPAPTPPGPVTLPEKPEQPKQPLRNFSLEFTPDGAKDVRLHVSQHSGDVRVSLHSSDTGLSSKLRDGVQDLFGSLDNAGYEASAWNPRDGGRRQQQEQEPEKQNHKQSGEPGGFDDILQDPVQTQEIS